MIIIGSRAETARHVIKRIVKGDWDFICTRQEYDEFLATHVHEIDGIRNVHDKVKVVSIRGRLRLCEFEIAEPGNADPAWQLLMQQKNMHKQKMPSWWKLGDVACPSRQQLAQIKRAHLYYEKGFDKHIRDYHALRMKDQPWDHDWVQRRYYQVRDMKLDMKKISLKKDAKTFFDQSADRIKPLYVHDDIHKAIANPKAPAYTLFQTEEVYCSQEMFEALPHSEQCRAVWEEAQTLAIERLLAPYHNQGNWFGMSRQPTPEQAFRWGLMRVCTTITSGWFRRFAVENWETVMVNAPRDYWERFKKEVRAGNVQLYKDGLYANPQKVDIKEYNRRGNHDHS